MRFKDGKPVEPLKIDKGVPIPPSADSPMAPVYAAAREMVVGDSITVPYTRGQPIAGNMARATGFKFTQCREGDNLRIWRIE